jgi:hypothetical protein
MHPGQKVFSRVLLFGALALSVRSAPAAVALEWKPVEPADLASKTPRVEKDADAEALFWEVWVMDELQGNDPHTGAGGAAVTKLAPSDSPAADRFDLELQFQAARYAQLMQRRLLIFRSDS